jgi:beta-galactosidase
VDNGDSNSHESYQTSERQVYNGRCIAIVRAKSNTGKITIIASSPELTSDSATIEIIK